MSMRDLSQIVNQEINKTSHARRAQNYCSYCGQPLDIASSKSSSDPYERKVEMRRGYHEACYREDYYKRRGHIIG